MEETKIDHNPKGHIKLIEIKKYKKWKIKNNSKYQRRTTHIQQEKQKLKKRKQKQKASKLNSNITDTYCSQSLIKLTPVLSSEMRSNINNKRNDIEYFISNNLITKMV